MSPPWLHDRHLPMFPTLYPPYSLSSHISTSRLSFFGHMFNLSGEFWHVAFILAIFWFVSKQEWWGTVGRQSHHNRVSHCIHIENYCSWYFMQIFDDNIKLFMVFIGTCVIMLFTLFWGAYYVTPSINNFTLSVTHAPWCSSALAEIFAWVCATMFRGACPC